MSVVDSPDARPARVIEIRDESVGLDAVVVIDHELFGKSAGGTRMIPDVTEEEVARLARAMTWKLAVAHVPYAGAKAGIRFSGGDRAAILAAYFARIAEIDGFLTGPDMGTSPDDFEHGHSDGSPPLWAQSFEGMHLDDLAVGRGILGATRAALDRLGRPLEDAAIAIEGFGKAGAGTAKAMHDAGARVVAVSTIEGALVDPDGLDVPLLLGLRREHGDRLVHEAGLDVQPREALFGVECDVLVPGARPDVITAGSASTLRASAIVPAANIPYADGAVEALHEAGILALPDFVSNAGGVHLYEAPPCKGDDPEACLDAVEQLVAETATRVLDAAQAAGTTPTESALEVARAFLRTARA
jgi:glutamate dehydrogenase (NAD(P)+)